MIDGGNSYYHDDMRRAADLEKQGLHYLDVGTSGGVFGLERGYCLMIGGEDEPVASLDGVFASLAPGVRGGRAHPRSQRRPERGRARVPALRSRRCRPLREDGAQRHRVRDHGLLRRGPEHPEPRRRRPRGPRGRRRDGPAPAPGALPVPLDLAEVTEVWRRGSVVASWLLDLTAQALHEEPTLDKFGGRVSDSGEGRWTLEAANETGTPVPVLASALFSRFSSRGEGDFANRTLSAMRFAFGGHLEKPA